MNRFWPRDRYDLIRHCLLLVAILMGSGSTNWLWADQPVEFAWEQVTLTAPWQGRDGAGVLSHRGQLFLLGGWNPSNREVFPMICTNDVWSTTDGKQWQLVKPNTFKDRAFDAKSDWEGRHTAGYAVFRDKMWIIGGDCNQHHYQNDVWQSSDGKQWDLVTDNVPWAPRALHYTLVHQDKLWVIGGQTMPGFAASEEKFYRDVWTSSDGVQWSALTPAEPCWSPRGMIGGSAVMNGRVWILGGGTYDTPSNPKRNFYNDVWSSADGVRWTQHTASAPWHPRQYHDVAVWDNKLWVMEGYHVQGGNRNDVWYSADGVDWKELPATPWKPRHAASLIAHNDALWMIAGNNMQPDVWKLVRKK